MLPRLDAPIAAARRFCGIERIPPGRFEIQVTASGAGDFFALHCDDATPEYFARMLTFVYYLHSRPRASPAASARRRCDAGVRRPPDHGERLGLGAGRRVPPASQAHGGAIPG